MRPSPTASWHAHSSVATGPAARDATEAALACAAALIERTGARTLAPALWEWRAELAAVLGDEVLREQLLRQAEQGYPEIGAPGHVDRARVSRSRFKYLPSGGKILGKL